MICLLHFYRPILSTSLSELNKDFTSSNIFNNSSRLLDFILPYLFRRLSLICSRRASILQVISPLDILASSSCAAASCFVIGIGLKKEAGLLLKKTSIMYSWRDFFAKSVRFINWELSSFSSPKLLQIILGFVGLRNLSFLKRARNRWHSAIISGRFLGPVV